MPSHHLSPARVLLTLAISALFASVLFAATPAAAQTIPGQDVRMSHLDNPEAPRRHRVAFDLPMYFSSGRSQFNANDNSTLLHLSPTIDVRFHVHEYLALTLGLGLSAVSFDAGPLGSTVHDDLEDVRVSNPTLGILGRIPLGAGLDLYTGLAVAIPTSSLPEYDGPTLTSLPLPSSTLLFPPIADARSTAIINLELARAAHGYRDLWRWATQRTSVILPVDLYATLGLIELHVDVAAAMSFYTGDTAEADPPANALFALFDSLGTDTHIMAQFGADATLLLGRLRPGVRLQGVILPSVDAYAENSLQLAAEVFTYLDLGAFDLRFSGLINILEPPQPEGGVSDATRVWAASVGLATRY